MRGWLGAAWPCPRLVGEKLMQDWASSTAAQPGISPRSQTHGAGATCEAGSQHSPGRNHWGPCGATATKGQLWGPWGIMMGFL